MAVLQGHRFLKTTLVARKYTVSTTSAFRSVSFMPVEPPPMDISGSLTIMHLSILLRLF